MEQHSGHHENMSACDPIPYRFDKHDIPVVHIDGEPHFADKDVCDALGYANASKAMGTTARG
ncbi:prophage antirepressor-like protein [Duganella sp. SG902]|nr:prophage antirepressor-like protein [Duganella sp. SG902]